MKLSQRIAFLRRRVRPTQEPAPAGTVQVVNIPFRLPTMNEIVEAAKGAGGHGIRYAQQKDAATEAVMLFVMKAKLQPIVRARFDFTWNEPNRQRDPDNIAAGKKAAFDGLVAARVMPNDGWAQVASLSDSFRIVEPGETPGVTIRIVSV